MIHELALEKKFAIDDPRAFTVEEVASYLDRLSDFGFRWWERKDCVIRTRRHTIAWVKNYLATEADELDAEFVSNIKRYDVVAIVTGSKSIRFVFWLTTVDKAGHTEYGIEIRKMGNHYACHE